MVNAYIGLLIGFAIAYIVLNIIDDDDDMGGGMMTPVYQRPQ